MKVIKILVDSHEDAMEVQRVLERAEETGRLDFSFGVKISIDLTTSTAQSEFNREVGL